MAGKVFQIAFQVGGALTPGFSKTLFGATSGLDKIGKKVGDLGKIRTDVSNFEKVRGSINTTKESLASAREKVRQLGQEMGRTKIPSAAMQRAFGGAQKKVALLENKLRLQRISLGSLSNALNNAGFSTKNFAVSQAALNARLMKSRAIQESILRTQAAKKANLDDRRQYRDKAMGAITTTALLGAPILVAANFEKAMNKVEAISGATEADLEALRQSARDMGRDTQFSATQAANAQTYLAMAGFKSGQIVESLPGVLNLAAAGDMDLARAADITSDVLTAFGLKTEKMGHLVDVFAAASSSANTNVELLGESMKYAAAPAKAAGVSLEETTAMMALMANEGIKGAQGGTALRQALVRLAKQPKETEDALDSLGVHVRDEVTGNMRPMEAILKELSEATEDMGTADRNAALAKIFGTEALSGMLAVMKGAASGELGKFTEQLENSDGAAGKMARTMNKGAVGALNRLKSAMESVSIDAGNVLLPTFAGIVEQVAGMAGGLSALAQAHPVLTKAIVGTAAVTALLKVGLWGLGYAWTFVKGGALNAVDIFHNLRAALFLAGNGTKALTAAQVEETAVGRTAVAVQKAWNVALPKVDLMKRAFALGVLKAKTLALTVVEKGAAAAQWIWNSALSAMPVFAVIAGITALIAAGVWLYRNWDTVSKKVGAAWDYMKDKGSGVVNWFGGVPGMIAKALSGVGDIIFGSLKSGFDKLLKFLDRIGHIWNGLKNAISGNKKVREINSEAVGDASALLGVPKMAAGGVAASPTFSVWGESGKEYMIPVTSPNNDRGKALWAAAGRDLGVLPASGGGVAGAYNMATEAMDAWDLVKAAAKGGRWLSGRLAGMVSGTAMAASALKSPRVGLGKMAALGAAGTLALFSASDIMSGTQYSADAATMPPRSEGKLPDMNVTYSPNITIYTSGNPEDTADAVDKALHGDLDEFMRRLQEAMEQERRLALE